MQVTAGGSGNNGDGGKNCEQQHPLVTCSGEVVEVKTQGRRQLRAV